jgi:Arc/MetJ-type ribon-helix-helix transcriptional regulator
MTKNNNTSIRLGDKLEELIEQYAIFMNKKRSTVIREGLTEWLFERTKFLQFERMKEYLSKRNSLTFMTSCEKCGSVDNLIIFHLDGNVKNTTSENLVTLCKPCLTKFEIFRLKHNMLEKFIEWFFV